MRKGHILHVVYALGPFFSQRKEDTTELDSRDSLGATPCFCLALMLHLISSLLLVGYLER